MQTDVMIIGAHPDDAEIGMGGTIAALTQAKKTVVIVDASNGEPTPKGTPEIRMKEATAASKILNINKRITLDMNNREIMDTIENRKKLAAVIREYRPQILFIPYWEDAHPDHVEVFELARAARFYAKLTKSDLPHQPFYPRKIFHFYTSHLRAKIQPAFVFDISRHFATKIKAITAYKSQFGHRRQSLVERLKETNGYWGQQIDVEYGEPFFCLEHIAFKDTESLLHA